jgi:hypothetical protein
LSSNAQSFSKCREIAEQCVDVSCPRNVTNESDKISFPVIPRPDPIQISFSDTLDSNEVPEKWKTYGPIMFF